MCIPPNRSHKPEMGMDFPTHTPPIPSNKPLLLADFLLLLICSLSVVDFILLAVPVFMHLSWSCHKENARRNEAYRNAITMNIDAYDDGANGDVHGKS